MKYDVLKILVKVSSFPIVIRFYFRLKFNFIIFSKQITVRIMLCGTKDLLIKSYQGLFYETKSDQDVHVDKGKEES